MKNLIECEFTLKKVPDNNLRNIFLCIQETHFHVFYLFTSLILRQIVFNNIILIYFSLFYGIMSLSFFILG